MVLYVASVACGDDDGSAGTTGSSEGSGAMSTQADSTAGPPVLDAPYGACAGPMASSECVDVGEPFAICLERSDAQGIPYSTCAVTCVEDADCPPVRGNIPPRCLSIEGEMVGRCGVACSGGANSCAAGTQCVAGDPSLCMWPAENPGHPDEQSFCETACGPCGATLFLPWDSADCTEECLADLADCSPDDLAEVFACTGGESCPVGGAGVGDCLVPIECVMGST